MDHGKKTQIEILTETLIKASGSKCSTIVPLILPKELERAYGTGKTD
jgi:hypothetical protein